MEKQLEELEWIFEAKKMKKWLDDIHFPFAEPNDMISYLQNKDPHLFEIMVIQRSPEELPQSYVHWWCYLRKQRRNGLLEPLYPTQTKWLEINNKWNKTNLQAETKTIDKPTTNGTSIFAMFTCWLDMLYVDIVLYSDERARNKVPRLYNDGVRWQHNGSAKKSRKETIRYIIQTGEEIFRERGFQEGLQYWEKNTIKYL